VTAKHAFAAAAAVLLAFAPGCGRGSGKPAKRIIVLGIDAMDPVFLERYWDDLPNLNRLRNTGDFQRLATMIPPQSRVAWSTFSTGLRYRRARRFRFCSSQSRHPVAVFLNG
jgi:hypothetical protein